MESIRRAFVTWDAFYRDFSKGDGAIGGVDDFFAHILPKRDGRKSRPTARGMVIESSTAWRSSWVEDESSVQVLEGQSNNSEAVANQPAISLAFARSAPPQELHFVAPSDARAGAFVTLVGPHGDPIVVSLPENVKPGQPTSVWLGPPTSFKVIVPDDTLPGQTIAFVTEDGKTLSTVIPPGKKPGDFFEICPPAILIEVPLGAAPGEQVMYIDPQGVQAVTVVPAGFKPGSYFTALLPVLTPIAEISLQKTVLGDSMIHDSCVGAVRGQDSVEMMDDFVPGERSSKICM
mmetsp:Transcript_57257/g.91030  ORF Transcript_57257/g.91030 Transcript_57257/m.91030 type:complete len:290 (+) Transcript_57257:41-910(+)